MLETLSALDDDGQHVAVHQLVVEPHALVVKLGTWPTNPGKAEFSHEITVQLHADVLHGGIVFDDQRLLHVGFLALRFEEDSHEAKVVVDEILEFIKPDVLER